MAENLKWQKLLWALVISLSTYLLFIAGFVRAHEILGVYPHIVIGWWLNLIIGVMGLSLRAAKMFRSESFGYVLIGTTNLFMAGLDIYFLSMHSNFEFNWVLIGMTPLVFSFFILIDFVRGK